MKFSKPFLLSWLPLGLAIILLSLMIYGAGQQVIRQLANDPQVQLAEDVMRALDQGALKPEDIASGSTLDIGQSLAPYIIITDKEGKVLGASASLGGQEVKPPQGVLDYAAQHGQHRLTWQPAAGVRSAIVVQPYGQGFVIAGRSLRESENRTQQLSYNILLGWAITMITSLVAAFLSQRKKDNV